MSVSEPHSSFDRRGKKRTIEDILRGQKPVNPNDLTKRIYTSTKPSTPLGGLNSAFTNNTQEEDSKKQV